MATCNKIRRESDRVCIGSLNKKIKLYVRSITQSLNNDVDYSEDFSLSIDLDAMIETLDGKTVFDGVNIVGTATHFFYIRYDENIPITSENWIEYASKYYNILKVENMQEENRFYKLSVVVRGNKQFEANFA